MITHSLIERGLSFEHAYEVASLVRDRIRDRKIVEKSELAKIIDEVAREKYGEHVLQTVPYVIKKAPAIMVKGEGGDVPFSKGILSQSLQASGLDPSIAHDISREIETTLLEKSQFEIHRDELRRLIYETIRRNHDPKFAERYLLWRCFKSPDKPLVILFGGATGTGKSSLATEVAHRLGISKILSTDTVRQIMRMMFSKDLLPAIHYSSYEAWKDPSLAEEDQDAAITDAFKEQSIRVLVGVRAMVERAIQENFSLVVDGVHLVPGLMDLQEFEDKGYIVHLIISTLDKTSYLERFPLRQREAFSRSARRYQDNFESILKIQDYILDMSEHHRVPIVENSNFDETVSTILNIISNTLQAKLKIRSDNLISRAL